ncbi:glycosyltransferase family 4 protein [Algoriphagus sp.]|uniref:glycosyltransferase family 4 protein n=1 Tax=Algoriphagus sp. TaxID=1872435 RepID=UPI00391DB6A8
MIVHHFNRDNRPGNYTFEQLFGALRNELSKEVDIINHDIPTGMNRFEAVLWAKKHAGEINHITGDVHFLSYGLPKRNSILTIHDIGYFNQELSGIKKRVYKKIWLTDPCQKVEVITVISECTKHDLLDSINVNENKIVVVPNPLLPGFKKIQKVVNEKPVILQIGSGKNKNLSRLIAACSGLDVKLLLINKLYDKSILDELLESKVEFEQRTDLSFDQLIQAYAESDMLFFASEYEGFGMPIIEAQAVGRPVITSNISSMPEIAGSNSAYFVDPFRVDSIRNAILDLIHDSTMVSTLVSQGFKNVDRFTISEVARQYLDVYKKNLSN